MNVSQFYGIEIEQFPAEVAKVALWLMDHLCNLEVADRFGQYFARIPIKATPHIVCANALTNDWGELFSGTTFNFIFGNPPFLGAMWMSAEQKSDMAFVFGAKQKMLGELDFVTAWFKKASDFIKGTPTHCAFVATNSITQGQCVPILGHALAIEIDFAYRTFKWHNEAKDNAAVHCVNIGFHAAESGGLVEAALPGADGRAVSMKPPQTVKQIYDGDKVIPAKQINGYLMDAPNVIIESRSTPICDVPPMNFGNMPRDGGNLIIEDEDYETFVSEEPQAEPLIRPLLGAEEFLNRKRRYCLWLEGASPALLAKCPRVKDRIERCRAMRLASKASSTRKFAATPGLFCQITQPEGKDYILVPCVSSERREYVPIGFLTAETKVTNLVQIIPEATLYHFGVLTSRMHNAWMRAVCGRLKSDYRYSKDVVYNNFIWPRNVSGASEESELIKNQIESAAQMILDVRQKYLDADPACTLAILYNPETMPPDLLKAHRHLDALGDKAYGKKFANDAERVAHLFDLYAAAVKEK